MQQQCIPVAVTRATPQPHGAEIDLAREHAQPLTSKPWREADRKARRRVAS